MRAETIRQMRLTKVSIVDAYAGSGAVWNRVEEMLPDVTVMRLSIEKRKSVADPSAIVGDNMKVLPTLDFSQIDLIDLDAFGFPTSQIEVCAKRAPDVPVVVTAIANHYAPTPYPVCDSVGFPREWVDRKADIPHLLFAKRRWTYWEHYLFELGYRHSQRFHSPDFGYTKRYEVLYSENAWATLHSTN